MQNGRNDAFTLIELLVTTALLVLVVSAVLINVESMVPGIRIEGAARELGATVAEIQASAAVTGRTHGIVYDITGSRYWILAPPEEEEDGTAAAGEGDEEDLEEQDLEALQPTDLHTGVGFTDVALGGERKKNRGRVTLLFEPGGGGTPHAIHLADRDGNEFTVEINPFAGTVEFFEGYRDFDIFIEED